MHLIHGPGTCARRRKQRPEVVRPRRRGVLAEVGGVVRGLPVLVSGHDRLS